MILAIISFVGFLIFSIGLLLDAAWFNQFDTVGNRLLRLNISPWRTQFFLFITDFGAIALLLIAAAFITFLLYRLKNKKNAIWYGMTMVMAAGIIPHGLKYVFLRPRPLDYLIVQSGYSFPSGHATASTVFYGLLLYLLLHNIKKGRIKNILSTILIALPLLIIWSRVYLGVHYPTDVVAGFLLAVGQLFIAFSIKEKLKIK